MVKNRRTLALAFSQGSIAAAVVGPPQARPAQPQGAVLALDPAADAQATGAQLKAFLRQHGLGDSRCVAGLESGWIISRHRVMPPCSPEELAGAMSIAVEQEFPGAEADYAFDFLPASTSSQQQLDVLLLAGAREKVDYVQNVCRAAGLKLQAVTSSMLALAAGQGPADSGLVLGLHDDRSELAVVVAGAVRSIRRLPPLSPARPDALAVELSRALVLLPTTAEKGKNRVRICNEASIAPQAVAELAKAIGVEIDACGQDSTAGLAQATAVASLVSTGSPIVDFLHSRLIVKPPSRYRKLLTYGSAAAVVLLALGAYFAWTWHSQAQALAQTQRQVDRIAGEVAQARTLVDNATFARAWYDQRTQLLKVLRDLGEAFPETDVWAMNFDLKEDLSGQLRGSASNQRVAMSVQDRLKGRPQFSNVKLLYMRQASGSSSEVEFALSFNYTGAK